MRRCFTCQFHIYQLPEELYPQLIPVTMSHLHCSFTLSLALGVGAGVAHHFSYQWPQQAALLSTIQGFIVESLTYLVFIYWNFRGSVSQTTQHLGLFLSSFVHILMDRLT